MTVLHSGTTRKYSGNWDNVFGGSAKKTASAAKPATTKQAPAKKAPVKKAAGKKPATKGKK